MEVLKSAHTQVPRVGIIRLSIRFILDIFICEHLPVNVADLVYNNTSSANIKKNLTTADFN